jgi:hypothetical protein
LGDSLSKARATSCPWLISCRPCARFDPSPIYPVRTLWGMPANGHVAVAVAVDLNDSDHAHVNVDAI